MTNVIEVPVTEVENHLANHNSNIRLDNYGMSNCCPIDEFLCYKAVLEASDIGRVCLVGNFRNVTKNTGRLSEIDISAVLVQQAEKRGERIKNFLNGRVANEEGIDLTSNTDFAPVLVAKDLREGPLVLIDGSHRSIAQLIRNGALEGVGVYICVHPNMHQYGFYADFVK